MCSRRSVFTLCSVLAFGAAASLAGCASGGDAAPAASGGSGGSGGAGGSGGGGQVVTACPGVVPPSATIADFDEPPAAGANYEWGSAQQGTSDFWGGTFNYPAALELSFDDGAMTAAGNITEYAGFGLYVQNCADASSFTGVRFTISGNPPQGKMRFAVQTNRNEWATGEKGSCLADDPRKFIDCVHPSVEIEVSDTPTTVEVPWSELSQGKPAADATTDGSDVIGLQLILPWTETGTEPYDASVTIDDVELLGE